MIYIHYDSETGEIIGQYDESCITYGKLDIPKPNIAVNLADYPEFFNPKKKAYVNGGQIAFRDVPPTLKEYDNAMEEHIKKTREDRGYTTREPDVYLNSRNERWKQDAEDFIFFRDAVMEYGLAVQNEYKETGKAPTLDDFKAGLPVIKWTFE